MAECRSTRLSKRITRGSATRSAIFSRTSKHGSGTQATCIPAANPALTPFGESSTTRHRLISTCPRRRAASRKISGAGLPSITDGSSPTTMWLKQENREEWLVRLMVKTHPEEPVATPKGMPMDFSAVTIANAPGRVEQVRNTSFYPTISGNYIVLYAVLPWHRIDRHTLEGSYRVGTLAPSSQHRPTSSAPSGGPSSRLI